MLRNFRRICFPEWKLQTKDGSEILPWLQALDKSGVNCMHPRENICDSVSHLEFTTLVI